MSGFEIALLCGVIVAAIVSYDNTRALLWLALGTANYVLTSTYAALDWPLHPFATAMTDAAMCITIYLVCKRYGGQVWELGVYTAFWLSVCVGFVMQAQEGTGNAYVTLYPLALELLNWLAILTIIGSGTLRLADVLVNLGDIVPNRGRLHRVVRYAYSPARISPTWVFRGRFPPIPS